jgi:hypothetical protein
VAHTTKNDEHNLVAGVGSGHEGSGGRVPAAP